MNETNKAATKNSDYEAKLSALRRQISVLAKQFAAQDANDWNNLPKEKRQGFIQRARQQVMGNFSKRKAAQHNPKQFKMHDVIISFKRGERNGWPAFAPLDSQTLIDPEHNIGVIFSAKCACTKVVLWYFKLIGLLNAAMFFDGFAHNYRNKVLYSSHQYLNWMLASDWRGLNWYQFCRDPVKRALSSYRHNLNFGYADHTISRTLGKEVSHLRGYSLVEFLHYLEKVDLTKCDIHVKLQRHQISEHVHVTVINIDEVDMLEAMNAIERQHGLPVMDLATDGRFRMDDHRRANIALTQEYSPTDVLSKTDAGGVWPVDSSILDSKTVEWIQRIYARDMEFIYGNVARVVKWPHPNSAEKPADSAVAPGAG